MLGVDDKVTMAFVRRNRMLVDGDLLEGSVPALVTDGDPVFARRRVRDEARRDTDPRTGGWAGVLGVDDKVTMAFVRRNRMLVDGDLLEGSVPALVTDGDPMFARRGVLYLGVRDTDQQGQPEQGTKGEGR